MSPRSLEIRLLDLAELEAPLELLNVQLGLLSEDDQRALPRDEGPDGFAKRHRRACRIGLRAILLECGAGEARGGRFTYGEGGKPSLAGCRLAFNVTHSGAHALVAVATVGPIGVDLEQPRDVALGPARRALIEAAGIGLVAIDADAGITGFLAAWTCLEAFAKARGTGVGALLTELGITARGVGSSTPASVVEAARVLLCSSGFAVRPLALPPHLVGAVCAPVGAIPGNPVVTPLSAADCDRICRCWPDDG